MKKSELIQKLHAIPGDPEVAIFDYLQNLDSDSGDGSNFGIYNRFNVDYMKGDEIPKGARPWIGLSFQNIDYEKTTT